MDVLPQPRSQGLSSSHKREWSKKDPGLGWSRVLLTKLSSWEGFQQDTSPAQTRVFLRPLPLVGRRKTLGTRLVLPGGNKKLQYIEEKIDLVNETIEQLKVVLGNANEVYRSLCKRLSQQSAQKADKKRLKRQQKEH